MVELSHLLQQALHAAGQILVGQQIGNFQLALHIRMRLGLILRNACGGSAFENMIKLNAAIGGLRFKKAEIIPLKNRGVKFSENANRVPICGCF